MWKALIARVLGGLIDWWASRRDAPNEANRDADEVKDEVDRTPRDGRDDLIDRLRDPDKRS